MNTKNIFRMLLVAATLLLGANNAKADIILYEGDYIDTFSFPASAFTNVTPNSSIRMYTLNGSGNLYNFGSPYSSSGTESIWGNDVANYYHSDGGYIEFVITSDWLTILQASGLSFTTEYNTKMNKIIIVGSSDSSSGGGAVEKTNVTLSFPETSYIAVLGQSFTAPTLINSQNVSVTYSSSNENVATVASNGAITLNAVGETTITASFAGNDTYYGSSASYTLFVDPSITTEGTPIWNGRYSLNWSVDGNCVEYSTSSFQNAKVGDELLFYGIYDSNAELSLYYYNSNWAWVKLPTDGTEGWSYDGWIQHKSLINDYCFKLTLTQDVIDALNGSNGTKAVVQGTEAILKYITLVTKSTTTEPTTATYALQAGNSFTSGQTVYLSKDSERVASITYGETGGNAFTAAEADNHVTGFTAFTAGNNTNGNATGGTFYTIVPKYDGEISVAVVLNSGKAFYILEDGTALSDYDGITVGEKYYGTYTFSVKAGKSYKIYCAGSKLGFYGFNYTYVSTGAADPFPEETQTYTYSVTYDTYYTGGSIAVYSSGSSLSSGTEVEAGTTIYISESHESNYELSNIYVTWTGGTIYPTYSGGYYVFEMPAGNINIYASFDRIAATPQVTIGSTGYATWTPSYPIDYSPSQTPNGVTAYRAESCSNGVVTLKKITGKAEANTPVLLVATSAGTYTFTEALSGYGSVGTNLLKQGTGQIAANDRRYVLTEMGGRVVFAQLKVNGAYVSSEQAYLELPASAARTRTISFSIDDNGNGTTGINGIEENAEMENAVIYDLRGQRVDKPTKGLYIINGKKVMIK